MNPCWKLQQRRSHPPKICKEPAEYYTAKESLKLMQGGIINKLEWEDEVSNAPGFFRRVNANNCQIRRQVQSGGRVFNTEHAWGRPPPGQVLYRIESVAWLNHRLGCDLD
jgi:hypothetical protein